jgi:hypothetical protein
MRTRLAWLLGLLSAANGVFMMLAPAVWYGIIPGVPETGAFNPHFVRDIGAAYIVSGAALVWFANNPRARPAALIAAAFFALHALVHAHDFIMASETVRYAALDLPSIYLPAVLVFWIAWPQPDRAKGELSDDQMADSTAARRVRAPV